MKTEKLSMSAESYFASIAKAQSGKSELYRKHMKRSDFAMCSKLKVEPGTKFLTLIPLVMSLPFNPLNPEDTSFNVNNRYVCKNISVSSAITLCKQLFRKNPALAEKFASMSSVPIEEFNIDSDAPPKTGEFRKWHRWAYLNATSGLTQKFNIKGKFGITIPADAEMSADGSIYGTGLSYSLFELDKAVTILKQEEITKKYSQMGVLTEALKEQMDTELEAIKNAKKVSMPMVSLFSRVISFQLNKDGTDVDTDVVKDWNKTKKLNNYVKDKPEVNHVTYVRLLPADIENFEDALGGVYDIYCDFLECSMHIDAGKEYKDIVRAVNSSPLHLLKTLSEEEINLAKRKAEEEGISYVLPLTLKDLKEALDELYSNPDIWDEAIFKKSIFPFKPYNKNELISCFNESTKGYREFYSNPDILEKCQDTILALCPDDMTSLIDASLDNTSGVTIEEAQKTVAKTGKLIDYTDEFEQKAQTVMPDMSDSDDDDIPEIEDDDELSPEIDLTDIDITQ